MEKAIVTFQNPETNEEIKVNLDFDRETGNVEVDLKFSDGYNMNSQMDFVGFLADMFLNTLKANGDDLEEAP